MTKITAVLFAIIVVFSARAQKGTDKQSVNKLCGCFDVTFKYAETFSPDPGYKYHDRSETNAGVELALPIEVSDTKIVIQHLLVITDSVIVKHWKEEWTYENPILWIYKGDKTWVKDTLPADQVKGKWTQTVWEVSEEPRYQGYSQFVNLDRKIIWQNTTDAPLPRREYSVRSDYNILRRTNRLNITDSGYIHEQDNEKIVRTGETDHLLTQEKGLNIYKRISNNECVSAKGYWEKNKAFWNKVSKIWAEYFNTQSIVSLYTEVEGKLLHEYLLDLAKEYEEKKIPETDIDSRIKAQVGKFIKRVSAD